jgi:hypothetical protein
MGVGDVGVMLGISISVMLLPAVNLLCKVELEVLVIQTGFVITAYGCDGRQHLHTLFHIYICAQACVCIGQWQISTHMCWPLDMYSYTSQKTTTVNKHRVCLDNGN